MMMTTLCSQEQREKKKKHENCSVNEFMLSSD